MKRLWFLCECWTYNWKTLCRQFKVFGCLEETLEEIFYSPENSDRIFEFSIKPTTCQLFLWWACIPNRTIYLGKTASKLLDRVKKILMVEVIFEVCFSEIVGFVNRIRWLPLASFLFSIDILQQLVTLFFWLFILALR